MWWCLNGSGADTLKNERSDYGGRQVLGTLLVPSMLGLSGRFVVAVS